MAARVISFPKLTAERVEQQPSEHADASEPRRSQQAPAGRLHLVRPIALVASQQTALRIVEAVCTEQNLQHPHLESESARNKEFWAKLPVPPARVDTPFSVARRVMHSILPAIELV